MILERLPGLNVIYVTSNLVNLFKIKFVSPAVGAGETVRRRRKCPVWPVVRARSRMSCMSRWFGEVLPLCPFCPSPGTWAISPDLGMMSEMSALQWFGLVCGVIGAAGGFALVWAWLRVAEGKPE